ncbi:MAG: sugar nucleotide-binding protein [Bacteriovoracaceae bacterium]|jgi:dTDP-4-dehydrorhamnose reductase|nr:sugar nucleotide-binding protein [Bacteriovoracaceae bacterium]
MEKILILGVTSNIGYNLFKYWNSEFIYGVCRKSPFALNNNIFEEENYSINKIKILIDKCKPSVIINCLGINNPDECEKKKELSYELNYRFAASLVDACNETNIKLINFSSSLVFSGNKLLFNEESTPLALNYYGELKTNLDQYIRENSSNYLLLRLSTVVGKVKSFQRHNAVSHIVENIKRKNNLKLVSDSTTNYLYVKDLCQIIDKLILGNYTGEFNIAGDDILSRYELGKIILEAMHRDLKENFIEPCSHQDFNNLAKRPINISLNCNKLKKLLSYKMTPVKQFITEIIKDMET